MMTRRSPILALPLLLGLVVLLHLAPAQELPRDSADLTLLLLGPAAEWLYPRTEALGPEQVEALTGAYAAALNTLRAELPTPVTISVGSILPPRGVETSYGGQPQAFVEAVGVDVALPSPADLAFGPAILNNQAQALNCPLLATDLVLAGLQETVHLTRRIPLILNGAPAAVLLASVHPERVACVPHLTDSLRREDALLQSAAASAEPTPVLVLDSAADEVAQRRGGLTLPIPALQAQQIALYRISGLGGGELAADLEVRDLLPRESSPLLDQPPCAHMVVGGRVPEATLTRRVRDTFPFDSIGEIQRPASGESGGGPVYLYEISRQGRPTHTLISVWLDRGDRNPAVSFLVAKEIGTDRVSLIWTSAVIRGQTATAIPALIDALVSAHGLSGLPEEPPAEFAGAEGTYEAIRQALLAAGRLLASADELP